MRPRTPSSTLFPYTTLFRSGRVEDPVERGAHRHAAAALVDGVPLAAGVRVGVVEFLAARPALRPEEHHLPRQRDRKSTRLNSSHPSISYAVFCLKKKNK